MFSEEVFQTFAQESAELLNELEQGLLRLEAEGRDRELLNAVFRCAHTIKGTAGVFSLDEIVHFTHAMEGALDRLREGRLTPTPELIADLLAGRDHLERLVARALAKTAEPDPALAAEGEDLRARIGAHLGDVAPAAAPEPAPAGEAAKPKSGWHITFRPGAELLRHGLDPAAFIRYLTTLGALTRVEVLTDRLPPLSRMDPEQCYLGFELDLVTDAGRARLEESAEFFAAESRLFLLPHDAPPAAVAQLLAELPEERDQLARLLRAAGFECEPGSMAAPAPTQVAAGATPQAEAAKRSEHRAPEPSHYVRVRADKLDRLINLVGEMVIAGASTTLLARRRNDSALIEASSAVSKIVEEIRDGALQLRMVQIGDTFAPLKRIVHDASRELGKKIRLDVSGSETELDKTVVEKIADPLVHLVRNAVDHGIEPAERRREYGKSEEGRIWLSACHEAGGILIEVGDDGGGLDRGRVLEKAVALGVVPSAEGLSEQEIDNLIFAPGLSTARAVSQLSGRGVGMDVVKRNVEALRGTVEVRSEIGHGTVFTIRLPLTLAIIDGFLVGVGGSSYVIPLDTVLECIEAGGDVGGRGTDYINLRGEVLPFLRLGELFAEEERARVRRNIVVVQYAGQKAGLVVDELLGEFQTVIKPLGAVFQGVRGVSGATILGSGEVAVILDVPQLVQSAAQVPRVGMAVH